MNDPKYDSFYKELHQRFSDLQDFISENDKDNEFFSLLCVGRYVEGDDSDELELSFATTVTDEEDLDQVVEGLYNSIKERLDEPKNVDFWIKLFGGDPDQYLN
jgi:precorrin-2 methylase